MARAVKPRVTSRRAQRAGEGSGTRPGVVPDLAAAGPYGIIFRFAANLGKAVKFKVK